MTCLLRIFLLVFLTSYLIFPTHAQSPVGKVERVKVHGTSLEGNLSNDSPDRDVSIYLPPSYQTDEDRRYPVVYLLHGFTDSDSQWFGLEEHWINLPEVVDQVQGDEGIREVIIVMPNANTRFKGSMYSSSATVGDWETFVAEELVAYIDDHYRTIPQAGSRGLSGHSMGGYGTIRIGMQYPQVFSSIYLLSPCCMSPRDDGNTDAMQQAEAVNTVQEIDEQSFFVLATLASAAAWAPNPKKPPFYMDLPTQDGEVLQEVAQKMAANATLVVIDQHIAKLKQLNAIAFDVGNEDRGIATASKELDQVLTDYDIDHSFEVYEGDHINGIAGRIQTHMLPFFSKHLTFE
ncbi:MAG: alpha/beta hydrolase-fold protein [Cyclobacteriaceae bacterium]